MARELDEWIGRTHDSAIPPRVRDRIYEKFGGICQHCTLPIKGKLRPTIDHTVALINGGENRENNMSLLCVPCHQRKTKADVGEKSTVYRKRLKDRGIRKPSRFPGSKDSGWKKLMNGEVVKR